MNSLVRLARYAWASPCTLVGLLLVAPTFLFGARAQIVEGVIEIADPMFEVPDPQKNWLPFRAITFGHVVVAGSTEDLDLLRAHEHAHVRHEGWGIAFFIAYPASSLWQLLRGGRPYLDNWFEVQARAEAGRRRYK